jgi:CBS domain-containing protein
MMTAGDVMTRTVITVPPDADVAEIARIMLEKRVSGLPVVENGAPIGIISESDLLRRPETGTEWHAPSWLELFLSRSSLAADYVRTHARTARDVMTKELVTASEDTPVSEIAELMETHRIKRVPVLSQDGRIIGIVSRINLLQGLARACPPPAAPTDDERIRDALLAELGHESWAAIDPDNIIVEDGTVHLWGLVRSPEVRRAMVVAARNVPGVKEVVDFMDRNREDHDPLDRPNWPRTAPP